MVVAFGAVYDDDDEAEEEEDDDDGISFPSPNRPFAK